MSERADMVADDTMKFGLLMESAQAHQKLAEVHLERLRTHTQDLDDVVRSEIRRTLIEELQLLTAESDRAVRSLREMRRTVRWRGAIWNIGIAVLCTALPCAIAQWMLPATAEIAARRAQRDALSENLAHLERLGGKADWRLCGDRRLCVRVDRTAPIYGEKSDYYIVQGY